MAQPTHTEAAERYVGADEPGWLPRATFGVCVGCGKDADYLWHGGDVFIPVCEGCACDVLHRDAPPPGAPMWCPKCQITWGEESSRAAKVSGPAGVVPDEVKRLRLEPGDKLIVRVSDAWHPRQIREYQDYLQHAVPDNQVLVLPGEQILTAGPGEPQGEETAPEFVFGYECVRAEQERRALIRDHPQPFASDCSHEIVSLPVIDERFDFQCRRCGGVESVSWIAQFSGESFEDVCQLVAKATGGVFVGHASETTVVR